jgi:hypothetical protein
VERIVLRLVKAFSFWRNEYTRPFYIFSPGLIRTSIDDVLIKFRSKTLTTALNEENSNNLLLEGGML